jgi:hypothetical protein
MPSARVLQRLLLAATAIALILVLYSSIDSPPPTEAARDLAVRTPTTPTTPTTSTTPPTTTPAKGNAPHPTNDPDESAREVIRAATAPSERGYLVRIGRRLVLPKARPAEVADGEEKVLLQFARPLRAEERTRLQVAGVTFHETFAPFTYLASLPESAAGAVDAEPLFRGLTPLISDDKLSAAIRDNVIPDHAKRSGDTLAARLRFYPSVSLDAALALLDGLGATPRDRSRMLFGNRLETTATRAQLLRLAMSPSIREIHLVPPPPVETNSQSAAVSGVPAAFSNYGVEGGGVRVGIWDGGKVRNSHQDLSPRVILRQVSRYCTESSGNLRSTTGVECTIDDDCNDASPYLGVCAPFSDHATHVAGTVMSSGDFNAFGKGMAPATGILYSFNFNGDPPTEIRTAINRDGIHLTNHSWGIPAGWYSTKDHFNEQNFGDYSLYGSAFEWDELVRDADVAVIKSAGNEGSHFGGTGWGNCNPVNGAECDGELGADAIRYDLITTFGLGKNVITVGSVDDNLVLSPFSSTGPVDDGRVKPDVVADGGQEVGSTCSLSDSDYCFKQGTSMSGPVVSGVVALLTETWKFFHARSGVVPNSPIPELTKAVLVATATDLGRAGPDYAYGHGLVKADAAVEVLMKPNTLLAEPWDAPRNYRIGFVDSGEVLEYDIGVLAGSDVNLALAWTDTEGSSASSPRYCASTSALTCTSDADCGAGGTCYAPACEAENCNLINDLDVRVVVKCTGSDTYQWPWRLDGASSVTNPAWRSINHVDNVEKLTYSTPCGGVATVYVQGFSVPDGPQRFALVSWGGLLDPSSGPLIFLPPNDDFANAQLLPALIPSDPTATQCVSGASPCPATLYAHNQWNGVNFDAMLEPGEPEVGHGMEHSVWYEFIPTQDGRAVFNTAGADYDTVLGAYTGTNVGSLAMLDEDDDAYFPGTGQGYQSEVAFEVQAGVSYFIAVAGRPGLNASYDQGVFPLNYHLEPSVCGNAILESGESCDGGVGVVGDCCSDQCSFETAGSSCDADGSLCTSGDSCDGAGGCNPGTPLVCNDGNSCTDDACAALSGCVFTNNTAPCEDGSACTLFDTCLAGSCVGGAPPDCNDGNACTDDSCNTLSGCAHGYNTVPCDDGNACTSLDACDGSGFCAGGPPPDCDDGNLCTDDACNPGDGCVNSNNSAACDADGDVCTSNDTCVAGNCVVGSPLLCDDGDPCTAESCDAITGCGYAPILECAGASFTRMNDPGVSGATDDGNNLTLDTLTGLRWLDLTVTTGTSINQILPRLSNPADELFGYRYATTAEVEEMLSNFGYPSPSGIGTVPGTDVAAAFLSHLGTTDGCGVGPCSSSRWPIDDIPGVDAFYAQIVQRDNTTESSAAIGTATRDQIGGSFLIALPEFDDTSCQPVEGTLNIHWEALAGSAAPCTGIEFTDGTLLDAADGDLTMSGTSVSNPLCISTASYTFSVSPDGLTLTGTDTLNSVDMTLTRASNETCFVGHWIAGPDDYLAHIGAEAFGVAVATPVPSLNPVGFALICSLMGLAGWRRYRA